jgi:ABC-type lipoprotein export system ATPase subunit
MDNNVVLEAKDLKKYYTRGSETVKALDGVDFTISQGEIVAIVGPSGSGKTTLMNLISCLDTATSFR